MRRKGRKTDKVKEADEEEWLGQDEEQREVEEWRWGKNSEEKEGKRTKT